MTKKSIVILITFLTFLVLSSCCVFATNLGDELKNSWNKTEQGAQNVGGAISNVTNKNLTTHSSTATGTSTSSDYSATRTGTTETTGNITGLTPYAMTWIIMAITAAIIVGLIWYYGTQNNETRIKDND